MQLPWQWLAAAGAQADLVDFARPYTAFAQLWEECPRGDYLLAMAVRLGVETPLLVQAACACAELALVHLPEADERPRAALAAASAWSRGQLSAELCTGHKSALAQLLEAAGDPAAGAAAVAVLSALDAISEREACVNAAASAAQAAVFAAGDCAMIEALRFTQRRSARSVREAIPAERAGALFQALSAAG